MQALFCENSLSEILYLLIQSSLYPVIEQIHLFICLSISPFGGINQFAQSFPYQAITKVLLHSLGIIPISNN